MGGEHQVKRFAMHVSSGNPIDIATNDGIGKIGQLDLT